MTNLVPAGSRRGVPRASAGAASQRPPEGRLAGVGLRGRPRGGQDAGRGGVDPATGSRGHMKLGCLIAPTANDIRDVLVEGPSGLLSIAPPWMPAQIRAVKAAGRSGPTGPGDLPERRRAGARARAEHRHPLGRRTGVLAASRTDVGPGDAGAAGRGQSARPDHHDATAGGGAEDGFWPSRRPYRRPTPPMRTRPIFRLSSLLRS